MPNSQLFYKTIYIEKGAGVEEGDWGGTRGEGRGEKKRRPGGGAARRNRQRKNYRLAFRAAFFATAFLTAFFTALTAFWALPLAF